MNWKTKKISEIVEIVNNSKGDKIIIIITNLDSVFPEYFH